MVMEDLATRPLDDIASCLQLFHQHVPVVALNLDDTCLHGAARPTSLFQLFGEIP